MSEATIGQSTSGTKSMTGCQRQFTIGGLIITVLLLGSIYFAWDSQEGRCELTSWSQDQIIVAYGFADIDLATGNDEIIDSAFGQQFASLEEAGAFRERLYDQPNFACWYNPTFSGRVSLEASQPPAEHVAWGLLGAALLVGGFTIGNALNIVRSPVTPPGMHQPYRVELGGGAPRSQLWFFIPMLLALAAGSYALFQSARLSLPFGEFSFLAPAIAMILYIIGFLVLLYFLGQIIYVGFSGNETVVEVSRKTFQPGDHAQLYVSHKSGRLVAEGVQISLRCEETTRRRIRRPGRDTDSYDYDTQQVHNEILYEEAHISPHQGPFWDKTTELSIPESAHSSTEMGIYPEVHWSIVIKVIVPNAPDFTLDYPIQVVR